MSARTVTTLGLRALPLALLLGCTHPPRTASTPATSGAEYCWNTVFHTDLPPDTVAVHFERAFATLGLTDASRGARADTAWAYAGPTTLDGERGNAVYSARVVAYRVGDSTHFRHFVAVASPPGVGRPGADSGTVDGHRYALGPSSRLIAFCGDLGRAARVHGTASPDPDPEASLELWRSVPR